MDPVLLDIPTELTTERLLLRMPRPRDGEKVNAAIRDSAAELARWMPWADPTPDVANTEQWCRKAAAHFLTREHLDFSIYLKGTEICLGSCGMPRIDWKVPKVEIGYWLRTPYSGKGFMSEAVVAVTTFALETLKVARVEIRCDERNDRSRRVAERAGFQFEGVLRNDERDHHGNLRSTCVHSKVTPSA
jgi:RimJ/RimL family protein N-acetyltransferase